MNCDVVKLPQNRDAELIPNYLSSVAFMVC